VNQVVEGAFRRHYGHVFRYLLRRVGDPVEAEDLTQDVFAAATAALPRGSSAEQPLPWLYTVAKRRFADAARRHGRERRLTAFVGVRELDEYGPFVAAALRAAIGRLPGGQRQVVLLKLVRGLSFAEIGAEVGLGPFADAADYYREALSSGKARVVGTGEWRGRPVYWLELDRPTPAGLLMGIDRWTYEPLVMKVVATSGETQFEVGLLRLEYLSRAKAPFGTVVEDAWKFEGGGGGFGTLRPSLSVTEARTVLGVPRRSGWSAPAAPMWKASSSASSTGDGWAHLELAASRWSRCGRRARYGGGFTTCRLRPQASPI
jgi:RNA polymerase sigma factor (sigma-70 family)